MTEILQKLNSIDGVEGKIKISSVIFKTSYKKIFIELVSNYSQSDKVTNEIENFFSSYFDKGFTFDIKLNKRVTEKDFVIKFVNNFIKEEHCSIIDGFHADKLTMTNENGLVNISIPCETSAYAFVVKNNVANELKEYLENNFIEDFNIAFSDAGDEECDTQSLIYKPKDNEITKIKPRELLVSDVTKLYDDDTTKRAFYICDTRDYLGDCYVAGTITSIEKRESKNGKTFYIISINDKTGYLTGTVFPHKDKIPKLDKLAIGVDIIGMGEFSMNGEYRRFTYKSINLCIFPKDFVPKPREKRQPPKEYSLVTPQPCIDESQGNFLEVKTIPECLKGTTFVIFDLETTGVESDDKITEIGAVKMVDGVAKEYFSTLVNPQKHISDRIVELTGIDDELVKDAPIFEEVAGDFYKFCYGLPLVAHNIDFDSRFIKRQSEPMDFIYDNKLYDTLDISRKCLKGMSNYKLNTLCDRFGIKFRHHRAYSDAWATSELLVELIRIMGTLPNPVG